MGWLPRDHKCAPPTTRPYVERGDQWRCDDCGRIFVVVDIEWDRVGNAITAICYTEVR